MIDEYNSQYNVVLFYKYVFIADPKLVRDDQIKICEKLGLKGRCLVASEGINATFEGAKKNIEAYIKELKKDSRFQNIHFKLSFGNGHAFPKLSVKVRKEIVSLHLVPGHWRRQWMVVAEASAECLPCF